jgi:hypothetical protein
MSKKALPEREKELKGLLATPVGRAELDRLAAQYAASAGRCPPSTGSIVTYILVHERTHGLLAG